MRKFWGLLPLAAIAAGCGMGDVPTENVPVTTRPPETATAPAGEAPQSTGEAIQSNPHLPPAAKDAILGKTGR